VLDRNRSLLGASGRHVAGRYIPETTAVVAVDLVCVRPDLPHLDAERTCPQTAAAQVRGAVGLRGDYRLPSAAAHAQEMVSPALPHPAAHSVHGGPDCSYRHSERIHRLVDARFIQNYCFHFYLN